MYQLAELLMLAAGQIGAEATTAVPPMGGPAPAASAFAWGDPDNDGLTDLYWVDPAGEDRHRRNMGDGIFQDVTQGAGLAGSTASTFAVWHDCDGGGWADLLVGKRSAPSRLLRNLGAGVFSDATAEANLTHPAPDLGARWTDFDRDGRADLHLLTRRGDVLYRTCDDDSFERVLLPTEILVSEVR